MNLHHTNVLHRVGSRASGGRMRKHVTAVALAALTTVGGVVATGAGTASAYTSQSNGPVAAVVAPPSTGSAGAQFYVPGVTVNRSTSAAFSQAQRVDVTYHLQYKSGGTWYNAAVLTQIGTIQSWTNSVTVAPITLTPQQFPAYAGAWRVGYGVQWFGPWQAIGTPPVTGVMVFAPTVTSDMRCGSTRCAAYPGYLWLT